MTQSSKILWPFFVAILLFPSRVAAQSVPPGTYGSQRAAGTPKVRLEEAYGRLPLSFEPNEGQTDRRVKFCVHREHRRVRAERTRLSAGGVTDEWANQMLRQGDAQVMKKYSQMKLQVKREALEKLNRRANEMAPPAAADALMVGPMCTVAVQ